MTTYLPHPSCTCHTHHIPATPTTHPQREGGREVNAGIHVHVSFSGSEFDHKKLVKSKRGRTTEAEDNLSSEEGEEEEGEDSGEGACHT